MTSPRLPQTPRMRRVPPNKSATLSVIDIGTNKIICVIAELEPLPRGESMRGRTHLCRVIGVGHQRSLGVKGGVIVDLESAERALRHAIDAAERMAKVEVHSAIVNLSGGRLGSARYAGDTPLGGRPIAPIDVDRAVTAAAVNVAHPQRSLMHALPTAFAVDGASGVQDPTGMVGSKLSCELHVVSSDLTAARNLMLAVERCHVEVEAVVATPYASGLSSLIDDEADIGAIVIDMGAGTTTFSVFERGRLAHVDGVAVGGHHVTMDVARGLSTRLSDAERVKTLFGSVMSALSDERDLISIPQVDEGDRDLDAQIPRAQLTRIIRPRIEEILELVRDRLRGAGHAARAGRRIVLTGGASQLTGLSELARKILDNQVRVGRPLGVKGLPEAAKGPAFSTVVGLMVYPQVADIDRIDLRSGGLLRPTGSDGAISRFARWLKESF
ncbi:cell division protein FtsA [Terrarubrum flagellatum]|uniref:cell division protein FtsA n=1 Tax=Terrirubrum flagellatum TaxID=2895980 RepID=UPI003144E3DF